MQYNESNYQRFMRWLKIWLIVALIAIVIYLIYKAVAKKEDNTQHDSDNTKDDDKSIVLAAIDSIEKPDPLKDINDVNNQAWKTITDINNKNNMFTSHELKNNIFNNAIKAGWTPPS